MRSRTRPAWRRLLLQLIASVGGIGFLPRGPATAATILGAGALAVSRPPAWLRVVLLGGATILGQVCAAELAGESDPDPRSLVIDEVAGVWLALTLLPPSRRQWLLGTVAFRLLDRVKPGPIGLVDRSGGCWSVMGDDLLAGLLAALLVRIGARISEY